MLLLAIVLLMLAGTLLAAYICFRMAFYAPPRKPKPEGTIELPEGEAYEPFYPAMEGWVRAMRAAEQEHFQIRSFDGLTLYATFYEYAPGAPIELMLHGYRGSAERDLSGGLQRCFAVGRSALIVDQRCCGRSEGNVITFGIREKRDALSWLAFMQTQWPDRKIILTGISMGAATAVMAAGEPLPENVIGVLADCGYNSPKDIMCCVMKTMGLPPKLCYPFARLGAKLFGGFDPEADSPEAAAKRCRVPVIFYHGEADDYVPCWMSRRVYDACASRKQLVTVPGAGHCLSYGVEPERYLETLREFFGPEASAKK